MKLKLDKIDVPHMLNSLGVRNVTPGLEECQFSCPFPEHHRGDQRPSAFMNMQTTAWLCWGCKRKGNAVSFVSDFEGITRTLAARWLRERYGSFREPDGSLKLEIEELLKPEITPEIEEQIILSDETLNQFYVSWDEVDKYLDHRNDSHYMFDRGFHWKTLLEWKIGWDGMSKRIAIPVFNESGYLVGFKGRTTEADVEPRYWILGDRKGGEARYGFAPYLAGHVVFGLNKVSPDHDTAILCEGELNPIKLHQHGFNNSVGISGSYMSEHQANLLKDRFDRVVVFFDSDEAGKQGAERVVELLDPHIQVLLVPDHDGDADSMDIKEIIRCIGDAYSSLSATIKGVANE